MQAYSKHSKIPEKIIRSWEMLDPWWQYISPLFNEKFISADFELLFLQTLKIAIYYICSHRCWTELVEYHKFGSISFHQYVRYPVGSEGILCINYGDYAYFFSNLDNHGWLQNFYLKMRKTVTFPMSSHSGNDQSLKNHHTTDIL